MTMSAVFAEDGSEPDFRGHESLHLLDRDFRDLSERVSALRRRMLERRALHFRAYSGRNPDQTDGGRERENESVLLQGAEIIPFDVEPARLYASIRRDRTIRPPDAIQLACAAHARVDLSITNDERLSTKSIPHIHFVSSLQRAFL
jgi:predicted nucleic acid-binding protein